MLLNRGAEIPDYDGVRTGRYVDVQYATGERELYDLRHDPDEVHNLAGTRPALGAAPRPPDHGAAALRGTRLPSGRGPASVPPLTCVTRGGSDAPDRPVRWSGAATIRPLR